MNKRQVSETAERWNGDSNASPRDPSNEYDITIIVEADGASLKVKLPGIERNEIMKKDYDRGIQVAVQNFEHFVYGQPLPAQRSELTRTENKGTPDESKVPKGGK